MQCCVENDVCGDQFSQNMAVVNRVSGSWGTQKGKEKKEVDCLWSALRYNDCINMRPPLSMNFLCNCTPSVQHFSWTA